jgi:hypothetical protein
MIRPAHDIDPGRLVYFRRIDRGASVLFRRRKSVPTPEVAVSVAEIAPRTTARAIPGRDDLAAPTLPPGKGVSVVGVSDRQQDLQRLCGGSTPPGVRIETQACLVPEPDNADDRDAVAVYVGTAHVGYLPRKRAAAFLPLVRETIQQRGAATCDAEVKGGGTLGSERANIGVTLYVSDRGPLPRPEFNEHRLPYGGAVSVSSEEHYQEPLIAATAGRDLAARSVSALARLEWVDGNPHVKRDTGRVLAVRIGPDIVGYLTAGMSQRFAGVVDEANASGKFVSCAAFLFEGHKGGRDIVEVRLHAAHD